MCNIHVLQLSIHSGFALHTASTTPSNYFAIISCHHKFVDEVPIFTEFIEEELDEWAANDTRIKDRIEQVNVGDRVELEGAPGTIQSCLGNNVYIQLDCGENTAVTNISLMRGKKVKLLADHTL